MLLGVCDTMGVEVVSTEGGHDFRWEGRRVEVPEGNTEGLVHELCHLAVASPQELRMPNLGLQQDWEHPRWKRNVLVEEQTLSLEYFLFGDPSVEGMRALMTPESIWGGSGGGISRYEVERRRSISEPGRAALALLRGLNLDDEWMRMEALRSAVDGDFPLDSLRMVCERVMEEHEEARTGASALSARMRMLDVPDALRRAAAATIRLEADGLRTATEDDESLEEVRADLALAGALDAAANLVEEEPSPAKHGKKRKKKRKKKEKKEKSLRHQLLTGDDDAFDEADVTPLPNALRFLPPESS